MKGNKINCNATSDDSIAELELNSNGQCNFNDLRTNNNFFCYADVTVSSLGVDLIRPSGDSNYTLRVRDSQGIWEFRNRTLECRNASNANVDTLMEIQSLGQGHIRLGTASTAQVGIGADPNASYCLTVAGTSNFDVIRSANRLDLIGDMHVKGTGSDIVRPSGDSNYTLRVRDTQAVWEFRNRNFRCMNPANPANGTEMIIHDTGNDYRLRIGSQTNAQVGIGVQYNSSYFLNVGGLSNFNEARIATDLNLLGEQLLNTNARIFQRADAFNSLNVITTGQMNFSLQSDRTTDPTTGTIALQLDDTNGITINRAVVNNQTFNSIGNITVEASLNVWGDLLFQHSSGIKETVTGSDYDLDIRNGDTDRAINLIVGTIGSTPEIYISDANVNLLGNLDITHSTVSTSERVKMDNPDSDGLIFLSINGANICEISSAGLHVNGTSTETSDGRLKENLSEINSKTCYDIVKYIKPKEFNFIGKEEREIGFIAQDILNSKMPKHWSKIVMKDSDDYLRMSYIKMNVVLWSACQEMQNQIIHFKGEITKLKKPKGFLKLSYVNRRLK